MITSSSTLSENRAPASFRLPRVLEILLGIVVALELIAPFFAKADGPDGPIHIYWIEQYDALLSHGVFPPRWLPDAFAGFGSPTFYFYPPLAYLLASGLSVFTTLTDGPVLFHLIVFFSTVVGSYGVWKLSRELQSTRYWAIVGALIYSFAPYRIAENYSRSSLSSIIGYAWLPFVCLGMLWLCSPIRKKQWWGGILASVTFALTILSSIPLSILIGIAGIISFAVLRTSLRRKTIVHLVLVIVGALLLDAFFLLPLIPFRHAIHLANAMSDPEWAVNDLLNFHWTPGLYHTIIIYVGMLFIAIAYWRTKKDSANESVVSWNVLKIGWWLCLFIFVLDLPISLPLWRYMPLLPMVQGPWRFYIFVVLLLGLLAGMIRQERLRRLLTITLGIWTIGALIPVIFSIFQIHLNSHHETVALDPAGFIPAGASDTIFSSNHPELFVPVLERLPSVRGLVDTPQLSPTESCASVAISPTLEQFSIVFQQGHTVTFHRFSWPAWHLYANGTEIPSHSDSFGRAVALLPAGNYTATWQLGQTPFEIVGLWISGVAWGLVILFCGISLVRDGVKKLYSPDAPRIHSTTSSP